MKNLETQTRTSESSFNKRMQEVKKGISEDMITDTLVKINC